MPSQAPTEETFRHGAHVAALDRLVRVRVVVAPVLAALAMTFAFFEPTPWRRATMLTVVIALFTISYVEWSRSRRLGIDAVNLPLNFFAMFFGQLALVVATGALFSPLTPVLVLMSLFGALLVGRRAVTVLAVVALPAFWTMAAVHARYGLVPQIYGDAGGLEHGIAPWLAATVYSGMVFAAALVGHTLRGALERLFTDALEERDRRLAGYAEQNRALSTLSAEIAHELKNPLASVKGLGSLVAKDLEGKPAERMGVLRREVDRMQTILEELLNFSRPLVPLAMEDVDGAALADDVVRMHEGSAVDRGVGLAVRAGSAHLTGDPRKIRQVLVNLVQNALHASSRGTEVVISIDAVGDSIVFHVDDRGPGIAEEVRDRLFEAGVTTKHQGSGIGLVVARALARQHGGDLVLGDREGGGCRATLTLPITPAEEEPT
ncbi:MAG: HAMP domain-containing histidine kinase [Sandaracinaceae bacterium]|nr:HAMP domain-containing histidine kinase [Sandaracinaceae bacterium]